MDFKISEALENSTFNKNKEIKTNINERIFLVFLFIYFSLKIYDGQISPMQQYLKREIHEPPFNLHIMAGTDQ